MCILLYFFTSLLLSIFTFICAKVYLLEHRQTLSINRATLFLRALASKNTAASQGNEGQKNRTPFRSPLPHRIPVSCSCHSLPFSIQSPRPIQLYELSVIRDAFSTLRSSPHSRGFQRTILEVRNIQKVPILLSKR